VEKIVAALFSLLLLLLLLLPTALLLEVVHLMVLDQNVASLPAFFLAMISAISLSQLMVGLVPEMQVLVELEPAVHHPLCPRLALAFGPFPQLVRIQILVLLLLLTMKMQVPVRVSLGCEVVAATMLMARYFLTLSLAILRVWVYLVLSFPVTVFRPKTIPP
jgi:hypothetical protein